MNQNQGLTLLQKRKHTIYTIDMLMPMDLVQDGKEGKVKIEDVNWAFSPNVLVLVRSCPKMNYLPTLFCHVLMYGTYV